MRDIVAKLRTTTIVHNNEDGCHLVAYRNMDGEEVESIRFLVGQCSYRHYAHDENEAAKLGVPPGTFTKWEELPPNTDILFYEGLHGAVVTDDVNVARYAAIEIERLRMALERAACIAEEHWTDWPREEIAAAIRELIHYTPKK